MQFGVVRVGQQRHLTHPIQLAGGCDWRVRLADHTQSRLRRFQPTLCVNEPRVVAAFDGTHSGTADGDGAAQLAFVFAPQLHGVHWVPMTVEWRLPVALDATQQWRTLVNVALCGIAV